MQLILDQQENGVMVVSKKCTKIEFKNLKAFQLIRDDAPEEPSD